MYCIRKLDSILYLVEGVAFYPASGIRHCTSGVFSVTGFDAHCWSSAIAVANICHSGFYSVFVNPTHISARAYGFVVRCVQNLRYICLWFVCSLMYCIKRKLDSILYLVEGVAFYPASGLRGHTSGALWYARMLSGIRIIAYPELRLLCRAMELSPSGYDTLNTFLLTVCSSFYLAEAFQQF